MASDYITFVVRNQSEKSQGSFHGALEKELKTKSSQGYEVVSIDFTKKTTEQRDHPVPHTSLGQPPPPPNQFSAKSTYFEEWGEALVVMRKPG